MNNTTSVDMFVSPKLMQGTVIAIEGRRFLIDTGDGLRLCRKAAGCFIDPSEGDLVLASVHQEDDGQDQDSYILTVLERAETDAPLSLSLHEGAVIMAQSGRVSIHALHGVGLHSPGSVDLFCDRIGISASEGRWTIKQLTVIGDSFESFWTECRKTAVNLQTTCTSWVQNLGDCLRRVRNLDETHAGHVRTLASETLYAQGKFVNHTAVEVVKIDGREVHLG